MHRFFVLFFIMASVNCFAQDSVDKGKNSDTLSGQPPQAFYLQLGGSALFLAANYEIRFNKELKGMGLCIGLGYYNSERIPVICIPFSVNYLIGKQLHFAELAAGTTYTTAGPLSFFGKDASRAGFINHINLGYRYERKAAGFLARIGISPLFTRHDYETAFYFSLGYNF
jgi:hypothetical protein